MVTTMDTLNIMYLRILQPTILQPIFSPLAVFVLQYKTP